MSLAEEFERLDRRIEMIEKNSRYTISERELLEKLLQTFEPKVEVWQMRLNEIEYEIEANSGCD